MRLEVFTQLNSGGMVWSPNGLLLLGDGYVEVVSVLRSDSISGRRTYNISVSCKILGISTNESLFPHERQLQIVNGK